MTASTTIRTPLVALRRRASVAVQWLASLKLTMGLSLLLAAALGTAVGLGAAQGRESAQWYVYDRGWFVGLLGVLAANLAAATWVGFSRSGRLSGLAVIRLGLVVLLAGCIQTLVQGIEGRLILWPGETTEAVMMTDRSQLTLLAPRGQGVQATELGFSPGPADWPGGRVLDFGALDGVRVRVLAFFRHAHYEATWVADEGGFGPPAIQVAVSDAKGQKSEPRWCLPALFDRMPPAGELNLSLKQAPAPSWRDDFLQPPRLQPRSRGVLSAHYEGRIYPIAVDGNIGKKLPLGSSGLSVEIAEYYANANSNKDQFSSVGDEPRNPMLRLRVFAPDHMEPTQEIAYANQPFVNLELLRKQKCPVKFWYHHPATPVATGAEFLQTPDGRLYCRIGVEGSYQARGEVKQGDQIAVPGAGQISLLQYMVHSRRSGGFKAFEPARGETTAAEAAALVELAFGGKTEQYWLRRHDAELGVQKLQGPDGPLVVMFGYERRPLGFSVKLVDFHRVPGRGATAEASYESQVSVSDGASGREPAVTANTPRRTITTNRPLHYGAFTLSQSGVLQLPGKVELSDLRVTSDPGRILKYSGGALIGCGLLFLGWLRAFKGPGRRLHDTLRGDHREARVNEALLCGG